jgi:hypothetical protein
VAAAKPLVTAALSLLTFAISILPATAAIADAPVVRITPADQARAVRSLLSLSDFATGWKGGRTKTEKLSAPGCPGFNPKESDLVVSGHADAQFTYAAARVTFLQDVQVLRSPKAVRTDFKRTITPKLLPCLAHELRKSKGIVGVKVERVDFPTIGSASAAYRAALTLKSGTRQVTVYEDFVFFGVGRVEYALRILAPGQSLAQLLPFEFSMAQLMAKRTLKPVPKAPVAVGPKA